MGMAREDIAAGVRHFPVGNHLILYRDLGDGVEVVRYACAVCKIWFDLRRGEQSGRAQLQQSAALGGRHQPLDLLERDLQISALIVHALHSFLERITTRSGSP
jgi:hypothetical protein